MKPIFNKLADKYFQYDEEIAKHSERVGMFCYKLAKTLGMSAEDIDRIYTAGLLHDIGKLYSYDIENNESLQDYYPIIGYMLLKHIDNSEKTNEIALTVLEQQENYDGSGFPRHIQGDKIRIYAMIIHLSDFYDTMRMQGYSHEDVTVAMREKTNIIFPKKIITPFIKMIVNNEDIKELYQEEISE